MQASDKLPGQDTFGRWVLKQNGWLPKDLHGVVGHRLMALERHGVWLPEGKGKRWLSFTNSVGLMTVFRDRELSAEEIKAVLKNKEQIKKGLRLALSAQWNENLVNLMKEQRFRG